MNASEHLAANAWTKPECYGGFSPDGDFLVLAQTRDSDVLDESNWAVACAALDAEPFDGEGFRARPDRLHA